MSIKFFGEHFIDVEIGDPFEEDDCGNATSGSILLQRNGKNFTAVMKLLREGAPITVLFDKKTSYGEPAIEVVFQDFGCLSYIGI